MFTICFTIFASIVAADPIQSDCWIGQTKADLANVITDCKVIDKDPLTTCEARAAGALKWFVTVRRLEGT